MAERNQNGDHRRTREQREITQVYRATVDLHNMLIEFGEDDDDNNPWSTDDDDMSDIDHQVPERSVLDAAVPVGSDPGARREQLKGYLTEYCFREYRDLDSDLSDCEQYRDVKLITLVNRTCLIVIIVNLQN